MAKTAHLFQIAELARASLSVHGIPPTPRNYRIWFAFHNAENPALTQRLTTLIDAGVAITPGALDAIHRAFFDDTADVTALRDGSSELRQIAGDMKNHVTSDRAVVEGYSQALEHLGGGMIYTSAETLRRATRTLSGVTLLTQERMRTLEQLLAASVAQIDALERRLEKSENDAIRDSLTGLANRRMFDVALPEAASQADAARAPLALLMLDIDHFKMFNDRYGHPLGDNVLRLLGGGLMEHLKGRDTAARYGGEEFAAILPGADLAAAVTVAEQVRAILESRPIVNRNTGQRFGVVTCSIGAACYRHGESVGDLIERADQALYRAKHAGRNRVMAETS